MRHMLSRRVTEEIALIVMIALIAPGPSCSVTPQHNTGTCSQLSWSLRCSARVAGKYGDLALALALYQEFCLRNTKT